MLEIVNHNMKYNNIKINVEIEDNSCLEIYGYKNEFMQSFLNIINNAKDALLNNDYKNRRIDINLSNKDENLIILIQDNAGGINNGSLHKIFKAYFSTKKDGHGIGLYMTKMIIEDKMGGKISVENKNAGACFKIKLGHICENISS
jgi:signal transduction histidine kinase